MRCAITALAAERFRLEHGKWPDSAEQLVKRGWTSWEFPSALQPGLHVIWAVVLAATALLYALGFARRDDGVAEGR